MSHQGELSNVWSTLEQKIQQEIVQEEITKDHLNKADEEATQTKALTPFTKAYNFIVDKFSSSTFKEKDKPRIDQAPTSSLTLTDLAHLCIEDITHHNSVFSNEELAKKYKSNQSSLFLIRIGVFSSFSSIFTLLPYI